jgi:nucleotide-binding universal stress UspA family protein
MTTSETGEVKNDLEDEVKIKRILVPLDGSNCSFRAAKYAIEVARLQKAQIFCVHVINKIPYGYNLPGSSLEEYFENAKNQAQCWFAQVINIAKREAANKNSNI